MTKLDYLSGFANHFASEALENALPYGQNSPQKPAYGLYAEQLSGTAFTAPKGKNQRSWLYRILPSVTHQEYKPLQHAFLPNAFTTKTLTPPTQMRWNPLPIDKKKMNFISGMHLYAFNGDTNLHEGAAIYLYTCNQSMNTSYFYNADGDMLIVAQMGKLLFKTEFGNLDLSPGEIIVIPRGIKFQVILQEEQARGYICENFGAHFSLSERGPIGANGLANERDFLSPVACYEEITGDFKLICKFQNKLWCAAINHSPLDVVAWHGNYVPYKYNLKLFNAVNTVTFDHTDPSVFTVLTSQSTTPGVANIDFVIFPERWMVAEHSFRIPYYHRNIMSEFMGLIKGIYDAKEEGFSPGGASLHNCFSAHGPDNKAFNKSSQQELKPEYYHSTLAFMFESRFVWNVSDFALNSKLRQKNYLDCWQQLEKRFSEK